MSDPNYIKLSPDQPQEAVVVYGGEALRVHVIDMGDRGNVSISRRLGWSHLKCTTSQPGVGQVYVDVGAGEQNDVMINGYRLHVLVVSVEDEGDGNVHVLLSAFKIPIPETISV